MAWTKEQNLAINEIGKNIIVSAGAGSGKTAVLSERVLEHIKLGINIDEMLILTFTNAAAAEMKARIRKKLLENNFKEQADMVDLAYITTFDSFALSLVKKYSYTLNISKNINIVDSSIITLKKEELLKEIFDEYYRDNNILFLKLVNDFCLKDDNTIFNSILDLNNKLDSVCDREEYLKKYIENYYNDDNINKLISEYMNLLTSKLDEIRNNLDMMKSYTDDKFYEKYYNSLSKLINSTNYLDIKYNVNNIDTVRLTNSCDESIIIKKENKKIIDELKDLTEYSSYEEIINSIYLTKDYVYIIIEILNKLNEKILNYKKYIASFEFIDINKMAIDILRDNSSIREDIKNSYKEILIDEYQDTNDIQDLLISLIENNNKYMVGDIKQSIYRFRNANPNIFKEKYDLYSKNGKDLKIDLKDNFRSRENVIHGINTIFNLIMDKNIGGASYLEEHQMVFGLKDYLKVNDENYDMEILNYKLDKEDKRFTETEIEIFTIAKDIKNKIDSKYIIMDKDSKKKRPVEYKDFAILIDRSNSFNLYKKVFEYLNIPIVIDRNESIYSSDDLYIIKNIYNLILSIYNKNYDASFRYSYISLARSFLFEIHDNEIFETIKNNDYYNTQIYKICSEISAKINDSSNSDIYYLILDKFDVYNKLPKVGNIKNHLVILDSIANIINNSEKLGYTVFDFLEYLNNIIDKSLDIKLSLNKDDSNSVKIMTIHGSKGLEYPICYYPSLNSKFNFNELKSKFYFLNEYGFITPYLQNNELKNTILKSLLKNYYIKEEISERLRLFYVALTRAREKIIFVCSLDDNKLMFKDNGIISNNIRMSYNSFRDILDSVSNILKKYILNINVDKLGLTSNYKYSNDKEVKLSGGNLLNVNELKVESKIINNKHFSKESHTIYSKEEKNNIELGLRMHYLLETMDFNNPYLDDLSDYEKELVNKFLDTKIFVGAKEIYKEYEFYNQSDDELEHGIIDLLLCFDDENKIIDYKLKNILDEAYIKQLNGYKNYIEAITRKKTFIYLYSIMDGNLVEIKK